MNRIISQNRGTLIPFVSKQSAWIIPPAAFSTVPTSLFSNKSLPHSGVEIEPKACDPGLYIGTTPRLSNCFTVFSSSYHPEIKMSLFTNILERKGLSTESGLREKKALCGDPVWVWKSHAQWVLCSSSYQLGNHSTQSLISLVNSLPVLYR